MIESIDFHKQILIQFSCVKSIWADMARYFYDVNWRLCTEILHVYNKYFHDWSFEKDEIYSHLDPTLTYNDFKTCDMVIEAVFEDINMKHKVIKEVEQVSPCAICVRPLYNLLYC